MIRCSVILPSIHGIHFCILNQPSRLHIITCCVCVCVYIQQPILQKALITFKWGDFSLLHVCWLLAYQALKLRISTTPMAALDRAISATASVTQPILISTGDSQQCKEDEKRLKAWSGLRLPLISEKIAILVFSYNRLQQVITAAVPVILHPIVGWLVERKLGKYKILQAAFYFSNLPLFYTVCQCLCFAVM